MIHCKTTPTVGLDFDGINDFVEITNHDNIDFGPKDTFTIESWLRIPSGIQPDTAADLSILERGADIYSYAIRYHQNTHTILASRYDGGTQASTVTTQTPINDDQWHQVAFVKDGSVLRVYIDGVVDGLGVDNSKAPFENTVSPHLFRYRGTGSATKRRLNGSLDELRFWNVARTTTQIANARFKELSGTTPNLVCYYPLNEGAPQGDNTAITTVNDLVVPGFSASLIQFAQTGASSNFVTGARVNFLDTNQNNQGDPCEGLIATRDPANAEILQLFPNPTAGEVLLEFNLRNSGPVSMALNDLLGRTRMTTLEESLQAGVQQKHLDVAQLPAGVYLLTLKSEGGLLTRKLVIEH